MESVIIHEREQEDDDLERYAKRPKRKNASASTDLHNLPFKMDEGVSENNHVLPPSHALLGVPRPAVKPGEAINFVEADVGISEYIGSKDCGVEGIIKQRFTDFIVYEVDQEGRVLHLHSLEKPEAPHKKKPAPSVQAKNNVSSEITADEAVEHAEEEQDNMKVGASALDLTCAPPGDCDSFAKGLGQDAVTEDNAKGTDKKGKNVVLWSDEFATKLSPFLSEDSIRQLEQMVKEGPEPPRVSDVGWGSRTARASTEVSGAGSSATVTESPVREERQSRARDGRDRRERGAGRGGRMGKAPGREDTRRVLSEPILSKETRTSFHTIVREFFNGKLDTETDASNVASGEGSRIVVKWSKRGGRETRGIGRSDNAREDWSERKSYPPYIHFTLQKTNRDTQDALGHLARLLHVNIKDLSVAGTKDKRGVTIQRVALKRNGKTVEDVWRLVNGLNARRTMKDVLTTRGERGIRISDLNYRRGYLELGMLKGNAFVITLRNVKVESMEVLEEAMDTIKYKGFINYYGMQRFGTASVPTHAIGLALLQSNWQKAVDLIMQKRHGEHPDVETGRDAWLVDGDLDRALELLPRRVVAERCILESFKKQKGETRNALGALSTIPRNLRLIYIHAYQSYVWNAIVSERIRTYGAEKPVPGDLVFDKGAQTEEMSVAEADEAHELDNLEGQAEDAVPSTKRSRKSYVAPRVKTLTDEDVDQYSIFDVIMPLPGTDVSYPGDKLGERYREFLKLDGLDPENFSRKQKEYTLNGSYRAMLHLPKELKWTVLKYTDPDVALAQSDEDKLLGFDVPAVVDDGKFLALQIELTLGSAVYATMALREITKTETSSHFQTNLTIHAEDQKYRGSEAVPLGVEVTEGCD